MQQGPVAQRHERRAFNPRRPRFDPELVHGITGFVPDRPGSRALIARFREEYYTAAEVAALCEVKVPTVSMWRRAGKITGTELPGGRRFVYPRADIDALAAGLRLRRRRGY